MMSEQEGSELLAAVRRLHGLSAEQQQQTLETVALVLNVQRGLATDVLAVADLVTPADELEAEVLRGACERARMVLESFGGGEVLQ